MWFVHHKASYKRAAQAELASWRGDVKNPSLWPVYRPREYLYRDSGHDTTQPHPGAEPPPPPPPPFSFPPAPPLDGSGLGCPGGDTSPAIPPRLCNGERLAGLHHLAVVDEANLARVVGRGLAHLVRRPLRDDELLDRVDLGAERDVERTC